MALAIQAGAFWAVTRVWSPDVWRAMWVVWWVHHLALPTYQRCTAAVWLSQRHAITV